MSRPVVRRAVPSAVGESAPTDDNTKDEIVAWLNARGIETTTRATKAELLELVS